MSLNWHCLVYFSIISQIQSNVIALSGIFEEDDYEERTAFNFAVSRLNRRNETQFKADVYLLETGDVFELRRFACAALSSVTAALLGPSVEPAAAHAAALCQTLTVPHALTRRRGEEDENGFSVDLFPPPSAVAAAAAAAIRHFDWPDALLLYQTDMDLVNLQELIDMSFTVDGPRLLMRKLPENRDYRPLLKEIKTQMEMQRFIIQADLSSVLQILTHARNFQMATNRYHYFLLNLDTYTLDLDSYKSTGCNVTTLSFVDATSEETREVIKDLRHFQHRRRKSKFLLPPVGLQTAFAVIFDTINLFAKVIEEMDEALQPKQLDCENELDAWETGEMIMQNLRTTNHYGTTGLVQLGANGRRTAVVLTVQELTHIGFKSVHLLATDTYKTVLEIQLGLWKETTGLIMTKNSTSDHDSWTANKRLENQTLVVTVYMEDPFVMHKQSAVELTGNDRYEGYCIDILEMLAEMEHFNYTIREVKDRTYGSKMADGQWNGMVGELVRGEADLAVGAMSITYSRSEVIDYTVPFIHLGIGILFKKPEAIAPNLFSFLLPLSLDVWLYMLVAYVGVSIMLWIVARFSPYEWYNPHPCDPDHAVVENPFNLLNSLWFTVGSLMQQWPGDHAPRSASVRLVAGSWWFFAIIMILSYTANLAAFLTVRRMQAPIENADDLAKQTKIKYGPLLHGSTMTFFNESKIDTYARMWAFMESAQPSVFVNSSAEGIGRVKAGDYAYLMESPMLHYAVERDCTLTQINGLLDSKGYGFGLRKGSSFEADLSQDLLKLQEKAILTELQLKWWKEERGGGACRGEEHDKGHKGLGLRNVGGVFLLLLGGLTLAFLVALTEFCHKTKKNARSVGISHGTLMCEEFCAALSCRDEKRRRRVIAESGLNGQVGGMPPPQPH